MDKEQVYEGINKLYNILLEQAGQLDRLEDKTVWEEKLLDQLFGLVSVMFTLINGEE